MTTPRSPKEAEPDAAADLAQVDPPEALADEAGDEQAPPEEPPTTRPPAGPAPAWAWVVLALMALLLAIGVTTLAVARNADPSTPEAVEDAKTLVDELEKLNRSLATTNELMSNAITNAEQLSAKAQAKLASLSSDVDSGVGQVLFAWRERGRNAQGLQSREHHRGSDRRAREQAGRDRRVQGPDRGAPGRGRRARESRQARRARRANPRRSGPEAEARPSFAAEAPRQLEPEALDRRSVRGTIPSGR